MGDAVAEVVSGAGERGRPLWWRRSETFTRDDFWLGIREASEEGPRLVYSVSRDRHAACEDELYVVLCVSPSSDSGSCEVGFATREAAMRACECHVQTGRWKPLPPIEFSGVSLTDADAADLLNALASPLAWEDMSRRWCIAHIEAGGWYAVAREAEGWRVVLERDGFFKGAYYPTCHAGRVACERHYLTGTWE